MAVITVRNLDDEAVVSRETITVAEQPSFMLDYADLLYTQGRRPISSR